MLKSRAAWQPNGCQVHEFGLNKHQATDYTIYNYTIFKCLVPRSRKLNSQGQGDVYWIYIQH